MSRFWKIDVHAARHPALAWLACALRSPTPRRPLRQVSSNAHQSAAVPRLRDCGNLAETTVSRAEAEQAIRSEGVAATPSFRQITTANRGPMLHRSDPVRQALVESRPFSVGLARAVNRAFDLIVATLAVIFVAPIMLAAAVAIALERKGPILFAHRRLGLNGRVFKVLKFRSMCVDGDRTLAEHLARDEVARVEWEQDHKLRCDPRVSSLGSFLRKSSVDELPQLFNVLAGEMSIVGPRPITDAEVVRYGSLFEAYCSVRPGITGVWQVSGRNDVSYQRRVEMDALYARKKTILLDLRLLLATIPAILQRRGSY